MKAAYKITAFFLVYQLPLFLAAQNDTSVQDDKGTAIFLLVIGTVFVSAMIGAAIVGAFLAAFAIFVIFSLAALGMVSTAVAIGLYKRSFTTGFKSFFLLLFGITTAVLGSGSLVVLQLFIPLNIPSGYLAPIGFSGGLAGGLLLGKTLFYIVKEFIARLAKRLIAA